MIIGISGPAGSGKDTVANYLCEELGFLRYSFALPLKQGMCAMFGWDLERLNNDREFKETVLPAYGKSPRQMMQTLGTEWGRELVHPDMWVRIAARRYAELCEVTTSPRLVIPDTRFENEARWIKSAGGFVWRVERPAAGKVSAHVSEQTLPLTYIDRLLYNIGSLHDLRADVLRAAEDVLRTGPQRWIGPDDSGRTDVAR